MKNVFTIISLLIVTFSYLLSQKSMIIDHNCTDLAKIPESYIIEAKSKFRIAYGHTSHGSQIVTGMNWLQLQPNSIYEYNKGSNSLYLNDASLLKGDLGNPDRQTWAARTRTMLQNNTLNINLVIWSWCGQVDGSVSDIDNYLQLMNQLESDFPGIVFIYMTGHLNGTGVNGNVNQRNEKIRKFCRENHKILFDFADIESYDPDGNYFLDKYADDGCNYKGGNWADEWCNANPGKCSDCSCAHSKCLNCQMKGKAFWWMLAQLAGWEGVASISQEVKYSVFNISPNPTTNHIEIAIPPLERGSVGVAPVVRVYDLLGMCVITSPSASLHSGEGSKVRLDVSHLPPGVYFV